MRIRHIHPENLSGAARAELLAALCRACARKLDELRPRGASAPRP